MDVNKFSLSLDYLKGVVHRPLEVDSLSHENLIKEAMMEIESYGGHAPSLCKYSEVYGCSRLMSKYVDSVMELINGSVRLLRMGPNWRPSLVGRSGWIMVVVEEDEALEFPPI